MENPFIATVVFILLIIIFGIIAVLTEGGIAGSAGMLVFLCFVIGIICIALLWRYLYMRKCRLDAEAVAKKEELEQIAKKEELKRQAEAKKAKKAELKKLKKEAQKTISQLTADERKYIQNFASRNKTFFVKYNLAFLSNIPKYSHRHGSRTDILRLGDLDKDEEVFYDVTWDTFIITEDSIKRRHLDKFYDEFLKLMDLMSLKGVKLPPMEWAMLINKEVKKQIYRELKTKIVYNNPKTVDEYIDTFVEIYGENYFFYLYFFKLLILRETPYSVLGLNDKIEKSKKKIELERFAKKLEDSNPITTLQDIDSMTGVEFEDFLKTLFEKQGYKVKLTKISSDQGADLVITKFGEKVIVQAKRYSKKVSNKAIQEAVAAVKYYGGDHGIVVTNNEFTRSAIELAESNNIELIDRSKLEKLL